MTLSETPLDLFYQHHINLVDLCRDDPAALNNLHEVYTMAYKLVMASKDSKIITAFKSNSLGTVYVMVEAFYNCYLLDQKRMKAMRLPPTPELDTLLIESHQSLQRLTEVYREYPLWAAAVERSRELGQTEYFEHFSFETLQFKHE